MIRRRIARAFGRFPFPDPVHLVFQGLRERLQTKAGTAGNLGTVIDLLSEIRVTADQWDNPGRRLTVYLILAQDELILDEDADPAWTWSRVRGLGSKDPRHLTLDQVCGLLLDNRDVHDMTTALRLWQQFGRCLHESLIAPRLSIEVPVVDVEVVSDAEFTLHQFNRSESLDLEALSDLSG